MKKLTLIAALITIMSTSAFGGLYDDDVYERSQQRSRDYKQQVEQERTERRLDQIERNARDAERRSRDDYDRNPGCNDGWTVCQ